LFHSLRAGGRREKAARISIPGALFIHGVLQGYLGVCTHSRLSKTPRRATRRVRYREHNECIFFIHPVVDVVANALESQPSHVGTSRARDRNTEAGFHPKLDQRVSHIVLKC
jgi:hypothetical protein